MLFYILLSVLVVSFVSLVGILFISKNNWKGLFTKYAVSFAIGAMLGAVFLHLIGEIPSLTLEIGIVILAGIFFFFILEKYFHWHHCHKSDHDNNCDEQIKPVGYLTLFADSIHNVLDGVLISVGFSANIEIGIATTIAVILHEIPQEIADYGLLINSGFTHAKALLFNFISACFAFLGVAIFYLLKDMFFIAEPYLIAFAIGNFLYIAMADLIPQLQEENKIRESILQSIFIFFGIVIIAIV